MGFARKQFDKKEKKNFGSKKRKPKGNKSGKDIDRMIANGEYENIYD